MLFPLGFFSSELASSSSSSSPTPLSTVPPVSWTLTAGTSLHAMPHMHWLFLRWLHMFHNDAGICPSAGCKCCHHHDQEVSRMYLYVCFCLSDLFGECQTSNTKSQTPYIQRCFRHLQHMLVSLHHPFFLLLLPS
jgi:hypothetical protein